MPDEFGNPLPGEGSLTPGDIIADQNQQVMQTLPYEGGQGVLTDLPVEALPSREDIEMDRRMAQAIGAPMPPNPYEEADRIAAASALEQEQAANREAVGSAVSKFGSDWVDAAQAEAYVDEGPPLPQKAAPQQPGGRIDPDLMRALANQRLQGTSVVNPLKAPTEQFITEARAGREQATAGAIEAGAQDIMVQRQIATKMQEEAVRQRDALEDMESAEQSRQERQNAELDRQMKIQANVDEAAEELSARQDIDPDRYWATRTGGQKFQAIMSAMFLGLGGAANPLAGLQAHIAADIDAQKANIGLASQKLGGRERQLAASGAVYSRIRDNADSEREADLVMENARLKQAENSLISMVQEAKLPGLNAQHEQFLGGLRQQVAKNELELKTLSVKTAARLRVGGGWALPSEIRRDLRSRATAAEKQGFAMEQLSAKQNFQNAQRTAVAKKEGFNQRKWVTENTADAKKQIKMISDLLEKYPDDIPGIFWGGDLVSTVAGRLTGEQREARAVLERIAEIRLRDESGAVISDPEQERANARLLEAFTEGDARKELASRLREAQNTVQTFERAADEENIMQLRRLDAAQFTGFSPEAARAGVPDPVRPR